MLKVFNSSPPFFIFEGMYTDYGFSCKNKSQEKKIKTTQLKLVVGEKKKKTDFQIFLGVGSIRNRRQICKPRNQRTTALMELLFSRRNVKTGLFPRNYS